MRGRVMGSIVMGLGTFFAVVACGGRTDEASEGDRSADGTSRTVDAGPGEAATSSGPADASHRGPNDLPDAPIHISGEACSSRALGGRCISTVGLGPLGPDLETIIRECMKGQEQMSPCTRFNAAVDDMGCITDLVLEWGTNKEAALQCIAEVVATRRWPCAEKGSHPYFYKCTLEK